MCVILTASAVAYYIWNILVYTYINESSLENWTTNELSGVYYGLWTVS